MAKGGKTARRASAPPAVRAFPHAPARLDFTRPLAPQFRIEKTSVRKLREFRRWKPGSHTLEFRDISLARVRFLERPYADGE